jgi:streptomycin 6-kinase
MVELWNNETYANLEAFPDPELAKKGCKMKEYLISTTTKHTLLATDLHAGNVLQAQRKQWLAIDLKPYFGDPCYDLTQHLINCKDRFIQDPIALINRLANLTQLDAERIKLWMFSRLACEKQGVDQKIALKLIQ